MTQSIPSKPCNYYWLTILCVGLLMNTIPIHSTKPNFIIFYLDDIKYTKEWSASIPAGKNLNGNPLKYDSIPTPNINKIMNEGIVFPRSYTGAPQCSPSRYSLLTGRYASRSPYAIEQTLATSNGYEGTRITNFNVKYRENDAPNNLPSVLQQNGYYTGMTGKWHLMTADDNGHNYICSRVDQGANEFLYDECKDILKCQGFDFVDGYYHENIHNNSDYSHNPEWMVSVSKQFIDESQQENKPFFLYFATTIAHTNMSMKDVLFNYDYRQTPAGLLYEDDIPNDTGMATREQIWKKTLETLDNAGLSQTDNTLVSMVAATIWIDNAIGAMIDHLIDNDLYDNTFIVIANDNGFDAKGTLYEHGSRIFQYIRYPPLFGTNGHIMSDDFIVANYDLASVIFDVSQSVVPSEYIMDGKSWLNDALNAINPVSGHHEMTCCNERFIEVYNSRAIVTKNNKYIFRATDETRRKSPPPPHSYPHMLDTEQLYRLKTDATEQNNIIATTASPVTVFEFRAKMINFIENVACIGADITQCVEPTIINQEIPDYTCNTEVTYRQIFTDETGDSYNEAEKINEARTAFLASDQSSKCNGFNEESDFSTQEYVYMFDKPQTNILRLNMILCCGNGKSFGSKYMIWPSGYTRNDMREYRNENQNNRIENVINSNNTMKSTNDKVYGLLLIMTLVALLLYYRCHQASVNKPEMLAATECADLTAYGSV